MSQRGADSAEQISVPLQLGRLRCCVALLGVVVLECAGAKLLGITGSGLFIPLSHRMIMSAQPGRWSSIKLPITDSVHLYATRLQQFWQMPWAVCFCIAGARPQWLFSDEVSREVFAWCCREANLALRMPRA